tara:strand:+ start:414 stop:773 length:360 start_codon:yes stop_codon:yes gene_type:complete
MTLYIPTGATSLTLSFNTPNLDTEHILAIQTQWGKDVHAWILYPLTSNDRYSEFTIGITADERLQHINAVYDYEIQKDGVPIETGLLKYISEEGGSTGTDAYISNNENREATTYYRPIY